MKVMKNLVLILFGLVLSTQVLAQDSPWYVGASIGQSDLSDEVSAITANVDDEDTGYKLLVGYELMSNINIEVQYTDLGEVSVSGDAGDTFSSGTTYEFLRDNANIKAEGSSFGVSGLAKMQANDLVAILFRAGVQGWDVDYSVSASDIASASLSDDGTNLFYGIGVEIATVGNIAIRGEYEVYDFNDGNVRLSSLGVVFKF